MFRLASIHTHSGVLPCVLTHSPQTASVDARGWIKDINEDGEVENVAYLTMLLHLYQACVMHSVRVCLSSVCCVVR